ncbi:MBL fold metallo-hydrolase [Alkalilacustris brevis]|uniref:MBL fold metallo-hydrolase n=1 Tax=Alkalilacustris brevis TaxID=2026338 RepID=UPI001EE3D9C4|nr:MBL fold metallo-hydrolase [Alkalilacustris brevis]
MSDTQFEPIRHLFAEAPAPGEVREVADGVLWARLPLPMRLDHVNVYALADTDGWSIVDTGFDTAETREAWARLLSGPLRGRPVARVVVTHHHPDHIGLAGWFQREHGAELWTTRTAWIYARMLMLDSQERPTAEQMAFWRGAGEPPAMLAERARTRPFNFADRAASLPLGYRRIRAGDRLRLAGREWEVHTGEGHAPEHATFWSRDCPLVLGGDQLLPRITPVLGVHPTEPEADPVGDWLASCVRLAGLAREDHRVLPGHKLPYTGLPRRLQQLIEHHHDALARLETHLSDDRTAIECFAPLFRREIGPELHGFALGETLAHLNHLRATGRAYRHRRADGAWLWRATARRA